MDYKVYLSLPVAIACRLMKGRERQTLITFFEMPGRSPYRIGDYQEKDEVSTGPVCYWSDHAVKEVNVLEIRGADQ